MKDILKKIITAIITWEAKMVLKKYRPQVVAVTGNVGKTSTTGALHVALRRAYFVRKSEKSYNSEIGVPLAILGVLSAWTNPLGWARNILEGLRLIFLKNHYPKWLILEVGADRPGDIARVAAWLRPDIVVVTKIGEIPVHVEFFASVDEVVAEKGTLVEALAPEGLLVLDIDSPRAMSLAAKTTARVVTYGFAQEAHFVASHAEIVYDKESGAPEGITFKINHGTRSMPIRIRGTIGQHHAYPVLAAIAVSVSEGTNLVSAAQWIEEEYVPPAGRLRILKGIGESIVLDDTYNASPSAVQAGLAALENVKGKRKIAVLGDMMELGRHSVEEHRKIGETVAEAADIFFAVGPRMKAAGEIARGKRLKTIETFSDSREAGDALRKILKAGDVVLVKGSQSTRMERVVEEIMAEPEKRKELLVRQDEEWQKR
ncbi:MAG: UDP-N-acetylmuramoyl-tripeptide--D-alanyl-D-alanine ligase [Patescibacteria group bacterium]